MANASVPLRNTFPRYHRICDLCGNALSTYGFRESLHETAASGFRYMICPECCCAIDGKRKSVRENAIKRAMVRHAARYSEAFGRFVAQWYGVRFTPPHARRTEA